MLLPKIKLVLLLDSVNNVMLLGNFYEQVNFGGALDWKFWKVGRLISGFEYCKLAWLYKKGWTIISMNKAELSKSSLMIFSDSTIVGTLKLASLNDTVSIAFADADAMTIDKMKNSLNMLNTLKRIN